MSDKTVELWLPTSQTKVTVEDGVVKVWDEMTMEKRVIKSPAGFAAEPRDSGKLQT